MKNIAFKHIPLMLLLSLFCAQTLQAKVFCPKPLKVAFYEYGLMQHQGLGIDVDVMAELSKRTLCPMTRINRVRAQIWQDLASGDIDISMSAMKTDDRAQFVWFSSPYITLKNLAIMPQKIAKIASTPAQFLAQPQLRWGMVKSYRHGETQDAIIAQLRQLGRLDEVSDSQKLFEAMAQGKIQGLFAQSITYNFYLREGIIRDKLVSRDWAADDHGTSSRLVFSKKTFSEADSQAWNAVFEQMKRDGSITQILRKYLPEFEVSRANTP
jgi:polar amino acid transport system substrate-binding protein